MPPFDYDEANPTDDSIVSQFPANERAQRETQAEVWDVEHDNETGRHTFGYGTSTTRDNITEWADGALWVLVNGAQPFLYKLQVYLSILGGWIDIGIYPYDKAVLWTKPQRSSYVDLTNVSGSDFRFDAAVATFSKLTLSGDINLVNPANVPTGSPPPGIVYQIEFTQDGAGGHQITSWGTLYKFEGGMVPLLTPDAGAVDRLVMTLGSSGNFHCAMLRNVK